ncbi:MAG: ABC transporter ATP-binding protein [Kordiimonadaceae bacterium]|nr:ABC transporter ATP-binding protein [Kordiimonadaceae bacterium]MBO6567438.1 ABC transporter ATP-binding protein [Kordiimonadaceae bacterium]MBO6963348.1 ABC transporter ATP-binding protein [Kordiimonadaceae bacterium]
MGLVFQNISHSYGEGRVLDDVSLEANSGEITCLLGPSGCGKTTLLRLAAGLMPLQSGQISLDDLTLATQHRSTPPEERPVGLVFQEGALFPHMTVEENIAFGIAATPDSQERVQSLLKTIDLVGYENRHPHSLSGGQQQRVALARALAPSPSVLLLDEPFANIDSQLRQDLRAETRQTLKASGTAAILVTHDPDEALEMADRIAILDKGKIVQFDTPRELLDNPITIEIATLFTRSKIMLAKVDGNRMVTSFGEWPIECLKNADSLPKSPRLVVRQNVLQVEQMEGASNTIKLVRPSPHGHLITVQGSDNFELDVQLEDISGLAEGMPVVITPKEASILAFSATE